MAIETFEANTFSLIVTWTLADGSVKDLTSATVEAYAKSSGGAEITLTASVLDGTAGKVIATAPADTFVSDVYEVQIIATKGGITRTYQDRITVSNSLRSAA